MARSAIVAFDDRANEFQLRLRNSKATLARWVGLAADSAFAGNPPVDTIRIDAANLEAQFAHHPQEFAQAEAQLAQANKKLDWSADVAFQQRGRAYSNMISIGVSIPLQCDQMHRQASTN